MHHNFGREVQCSSFKSTGLSGAGRNRPQQCACSWDRSQDRTFKYSGTEAMNHFITTKSLLSIKVLFSLKKIIKINFVFSHQIFTRLEKTWWDNVIAERLAMTKCFCSALLCVPCCLLHFESNNGPVTLRRHGNQCSRLRQVLVILKSLKWQQFPLKQPLFHQMDGREN